MTNKEKTAWLGRYLHEQARQRMLYGEVEALQAQAADAVANVHKRPSLRVGLKLLNCKAVYIKPPCAPFVNIACVNFSMILRLKV